jgi:hypothetical protein
MLTEWPASMLEADKLPAPHGWIQWKGTDVCMDLHCECGAHGHVDAEFAYFYKCLSCGTVYAVGSSVRLYKIDPNHVAKITDENRLTMDERLVA